MSVATEVNFFRIKPKVRNKKKNINFNATAKKNENIVAYLLHARNVTSKHLPEITQQ
jgi:hypothetical protein